MSEQGDTLQVEALVKAIQGFHDHRSKEGEIRLGRDDEAWRDWNVKLKEHLLEVKAKARDFESRHTLSPSERQELGKRGRDLSVRLFGLYTLSALVILVASYPASLSTASILGTPVAMVGGLKVVWPLWIWFFLLVLVAELLLVTSLSRLLWHADVKANLDSGQALDESERRQGKRMVIMDPTQQRIAQLWLLAQASLATMLVLIDFAANIQFLVFESEAGLGISFFLAFAGFLSFLGIAVLLGRTKYKEELIETALCKKRDGYAPRARFTGLANGP